MAQPPSVTDRSAIIAELDRVLESSTFNGARRSRRFLRYLTEHALACPGDHIKEYSIALDVFERDPSYDPTVDATVRVEAGRLRSRLRDYYAGEGHDDRVRIDIPKGSYAASFISLPGPPSDSADALQPSSGPVRPVGDYSLRVRWMLVLFFLAGCLFGFLAAH